MSTKTAVPPIVLLPRIIRAKDAPFYLGMDKNRFNKEVRPQLVALRIGVQGVGFDRLDLDAWVEDYKCRVGRPVSDTQEKTSCQKRHRALPKEMMCGTSTKSSKEKDFTKALEQVTSKKRSAI